MQDRLRSTTGIVAGLFVVLLVGTFVYYKERMLFINPGWVVFNILNRGTVLIAEY